MIHILLEGENEANKASTIHNESYEGMMAECVFKRGQTRERQPLVFEMAQHWFAIEQPKQCEKEVPTCSSPERNLSFPRDWQAESEDLMEHTDLHENDCEEDEDMATAEGCEEDESQRHAREEAGQEVALLLRGRRRSLCGAGGGGESVLGRG